LETLAGPDRVEGGLGASLRALSRAVGADAVALFVDRGGGLDLHAADSAATIDGDLGARLRAAASAVEGPPGAGRARMVAPDLAAVALGHPEGRAVVVAHLAGAGTAVAESLELLDDATRALAVALEGEALERARREAAALRRSQAIQRELLSSLSHELDRKSTRLNSSH